MKVSFVNLMGNDIWKANLSWKDVQDMELEPF